MAKVVLDAGHGGTDPGAVFNGREEKEDNLNLTLAVGEALRERGVDVVFTRTEDVYQTPFEKTRIANPENADFLISFHRNSSPEANQYTGVETLVYNNQGKKVQMAEAINKELEKVGFRNIGVKERPGLVILRRSTAPALLVETGFINSEEDNTLFDEKFEEIVEAITNGILEVLNESQEETLYRVQVGAFRNQEYAQNLLTKLLQQGIQGYILRDSDLYKVQAGAFRNLDNAIKMEALLRSRGYSTFITT